MLIYNKKISVSPITTHIPVKTISSSINKKKIIYQAMAINKFYRKNLKKNIKLAITGLNPHSYSSDKGSEEEKIIIPAIKALKKKKLNVHGPFSADSFFTKENIRKFDVIIGMYHDQILTPIKSLYGFKSINITIGLPIIRISPDHGVGEDKMGKNIANPTSLIESVKFFNSVY